MPYRQSFCLRRAGCLGLLAVACGAFGTHGLKTLLAGLGPDETARRLDWVATGARYQLIHAAALLALGALSPGLNPSTLAWTARCFFYGSLVFGLSLYAMALGAPLWLGAVTPLGGLLLLGGWGLCLFSKAQEP